MNPCVTQTYPSFIHFQIFNFQPYNQKNFHEHVPLAQSRPDRPTSEVFLGSLPRDTWNVFLKRINIVGNIASYFLKSTALSFGFLIKSHESNPSDGARQAWRIGRHTMAFVVRNSAVFLDTKWFTSFCETIDRKNCESCVGRWPIWCKNAFSPWNLAQNAPGTGRLRENPQSSFVVCAVHSFENVGNNPTLFELKMFEKPQWNFKPVFFQVKVDTCPQKQYTFRKKQTDIKTKIRTLKLLYISYKYI